LTNTQPINQTIYQPVTDKEFPKYCYHVNQSQSV